MKLIEHLKDLLAARIENDLIKEELTKSEINMATNVVLKLNILVEM
jgi:hypothetical protein